MVRKVELLEANPMYARVRYDDGRESNVSLRDIARYPRDDCGRRLREDTDDRVCEDNKPQAEETVDQTRTSDVALDEICDDDKLGDNDVESPEYSLGDNEVNVEHTELRRSTRHNKGVPPERFGYP